MSALKKRVLAPLGMILDKKESPGAICSGALFFCVQSSSMGAENSEKVNCGFLSFVQFTAHWEPKQKLEVLF